MEFAYAESETIANDTAAGDIAVNKTVVNETGVKNTPVKKTPVKKTVAKKTPVGKTAVKKADAKKTPAKKPDAKKTVVKETPVKKTDTKETVKETVVTKTPESVITPVSSIDKSSAFKVYVYMDRLTFDANEPVILQLNIRNNTGSGMSFKIFDTDYANFRPLVYDMKGREEDTLVDYRLKNKSIADTIKGIQPRIIELAGNETFSYAVDLRKIYNIQPDKEYRVKAYFSPDADDAVSILSNNQLNFRISRSTGNFPNTGIARYKQFSSPERRLSPTEVVMLFLKAEKDRNWDNYLKYIDIDKYINAYPDYIMVYNEAVRKNDVELKEKIILEFVNFLKADRSDYITDYQVQNELKEDENSTYVEAMVTRFSAKLPLMYRYRYSLKRFENLWLITDVEVTVSKGRNI